MRVEVGCRGEVGKVLRNELFGKVGFKGIWC